MLHFQSSGYDFIMKMITDEAIASVLSYAEVEQQLHAAFTSLACGKAQIQARTRIDCGATKLSSMGAVWHDPQHNIAVAGSKNYTTVGGQFNFAITLFDLHTGATQLLAGNEITRFRTPALTTLVARATLVRTTQSAPKKLALFGAGVQGRAHAQALQEAFGFTQIDVVELADVSVWIDAFALEHGVKVRRTDAESAVRGAHLIVTATRSKTPVFEGAWLERGAVVCAVGTSLPTGSELDMQTLWRADKVIVEWKPQSCVEAGEIVVGLNQGVLTQGSIIDLIDVFSGKANWRDKPDDIIVFKAVGVGLSDLATAALAVKKLQTSPQSAAA
jgi:ornithine cyclodeaminase